MTQKTTLLSMAFLIALFALPFTGGQAFAHDSHHGNNHKSKHERQHHGYKEQYRQPQQYCRQVVQEFKVSHFLTYSETGLACKTGNGAWQVVSQTKYPSLFGQVFFINNGRREYLGEVSPRPRPYQQHDYHGHGNHNDRNYDYLDRKNHKNR